LARDDLIQIEGVVEEVRAGGNFLIKTDMGPTITAKLSGRMRRFRIRVVPGDRVTVGVSPYDPTKGLITYRTK
jgi:translation initiation factor IF-1